MAAARFPRNMHFDLARRRRPVPGKMIRERNVLLHIRCKQPASIRGHVLLTIFSAFPGVKFAPLMWETGKKTEWTTL